MHRINFRKCNRSSTAGQSFSLFVGILGWWSVDSTCQFPSTGAPPRIVAFEETALEKAEADSGIILPPASRSYAELIERLILWCSFQEFIWNRVLSWLDMDGCSQILCTAIRSVKYGYCSAEGKNLLLLSLFLAAIWLLQKEENRQWFEGLPVTACFMDHVRNCVAS